MRIVKPIEECSDLTNHAKWVTENTIEIKLDDFREWYYQTWFGNEGGLIHYDSVPALIQEWLNSIMSTNTDLENNDTESV